MDNDNDNDDYNDDGYTLSSPYEPNGSGELKRIVTLLQSVNKAVISRILKQFNVYPLTYLTLLSRNVCIRAVVLTTMLEVK